MSTLPLVENMTAIIENRQLYLDMSQLRVEQQACAQKIETLGGSILSSRGTCNYTRCREEGNTRE
jgi:hypothetical protein